jgi:hypothetical protein
MNAFMGASWSSMLSSIHPIADRHSDDIVPLVQQAQRLLEAGLEEVRDHEHRRPLSHHLRDIVQRQRNIGLSLGHLEVEQLANQTQDVPAALLGRDEQLNAVREDQQADFVVVLGRREGQDRADSAASSFFLLLTVPNSPEALRSTANSTVISRSSTNRLMNGWPVRAVTFQSMARMSSPGMYSRTSSNWIPRPLNTLSYWPAKLAFTARAV